MLPLPPRSTLFPYTTLFRSEVRVLELSRPLRRIIRRAGRDWDEEPQALKPRTIPEGLAEDRPGSGLEHAVQLSRHLALLPQVVQNRLADDGVVASIVVGEGVE